jgi:hypothetical protein
MSNNARRRATHSGDLTVELTPEHVQALLQLCDAIALRGPASKMVVAQAQARLMRALEAVAALNGQPPHANPDQPPT